MWYVEETDAGRFEVDLSSTSDLVPVLDPLVREELVAVLRAALTTAVARHQQTQAPAEEQGG